MSTPGGPYWQEQHPQYQVDPLTGQPVSQQPQQTGFQGGGYQGFGMYPQRQPEPPKPNRTPLIVTLVVVVVVAIGAVTTLLLVNRDSDDPAPVAAPSSSAEKTTADRPTATRKPVTSSPRPTTSTTPTDVSQIKVDPVISGWQGVLSPKEGVAYDVPKDWEVEKPSVIVGFDDNEGKPTAVMHGVSTYKPEACADVKGSYRGHVGFVSAGTAEPERAARNGAKLFADAAALNADGSKAPVTVTDPVPAKVDHGKIDAVSATATLTVNQPGECSSPTVLFTTVAFKNGANTVLFMMYMDQGTPDALPADIAAQVVSSIRPHKD
ncbi:hypothetical protein [Actinokineospora iranica]|uniref:DUF8017 domain-containing protein n=1 Tax=Actinokineospora iranica TaxID=1271860 RepID=A0A1G6KMC0_9PSEU|nr:hypothetical protein [Actinokineospora iranica]SDC32113.1 hypothetical protein SAMN05216174_101991 [Actinokineospora iranica]